VDCSAFPGEAEVELYDIPTAPPMLDRVHHFQNRPPKVTQYANEKALVMHAHRRDDPSLDDRPHWGCSSKMSQGALIAHNRHALEDKRPWPASQPQIRFGIIYQQWKRDPTSHPSFPGNEGNDFPNVPITPLIQFSNRVLASTLRDTLEIP
jgi:hypothetical protein